MATVQVPLGSSLQGAINAGNPPGTTYQLASGIYYLSSQIFPQSGDTLLGAADGGTIFSGAIILSNWSRSGAFWVASGLPNQKIDNAPAINPFARFCNDLWVNNRWFPPVDTLGALSSGHCFFDTSSNSMFIADNPAGLLIEYSTNGNFSFDDSRNNITLQNFTIEKFCSNASVGAIHGSGPGARFVNMTLRFNHGTGLVLGASGSAVSCAFVTNGQSGIESFQGHNSSVTGCEMAFNNYAGYDSGWDAAGLKFVTCNNVHLTNCYSHDNNGAGLWVDIHSVGWVIDGNYVANNKDNGIHYEISSSAQITNNTVLGNGLAGIFISNSQTSTVTGNKVWAGAGTSGVYNGALSVVSVGRGDSPPWGVNDTVHNNQIVFSTNDNSQFGSFTDIGFSEGGATGGNTFDFDTFYIPSSSRKAFHFETNDSAHDFTWASLHASTGYEPNGTAIFAAGPAPPAPPVLNAGVTGGGGGGGGGTGGGGVTPPGGGVTGLPGKIGGTESGHGGGIGGEIATGGNLSTTVTGPAGDPWVPAFVPAFGPAVIGGGGGGGGGLSVQRNPGGGWVSTGSSSNAVLLLFYNEIVYYEDSTWHQWNGSSWTDIVGDPRVPIESAQGATLTGPGGTIFNSTLHKFTLVPVAGQGQEIYIDGNYSSPTANVVLLLYWNHAVYQQNNAGGWWVYDGTTPWAELPGDLDPRIVESVQGTTLTMTTGALYDANRTPFTLVPSATQGLQISIGGIVDRNTSNVVVLLYWNHQIYQQSTSSGWWFYDGTTPWVSTTDPRGTGGTPPSFFDDFASLSLIDSRTPSTAGNNWQPVFWYAPDGIAANSTWLVNPFSPVTFIPALYTASGGSLTLTMESTPSQFASGANNLPYIGAQLTTEPHFQQAVGYFECQVNVPKIPGTVFTFRLMQDVQWPPEIDVCQIACGQNADSSVWQVVKSTLWNSTPSSPQIVAQVSSFNNPGGVVIDPSTGSHLYGVLVDATNVTFYWDRVQVGQFPLPAGYAGFKFFPAISVNDGGSYTGPVTNTALLPFSCTVGYVEVWLAIPFTPAAKPTITNVQLASLQVVAGASVGTLVSQVRVVMSDGSMFAGTLTLSGTNAGTFAINGTNLVTAATITQGTNYAVSITAATPSSSLTKSFTIAGVAQSTLGPGPLASSVFLIADFTSNFAYPGGTGQQIVSQRMYGVSTGNAGNTAFAVLANPSFQTAAAAINPGLWRFSGTLPERGDTAYFNVNQTVNTNTFASLINNFDLLDPLSVAGIIIGVDIGIIAGVTGVSSVATYQTAMSNLATFLNNAVMPNGKKLPIIGFECQNEPDGRISIAQLAPYYNAMRTAVKAVNSNFLVFGPTGSFAGAMMPGFQQGVAGVDVIDYHSFLGGFTSGAGPGESAYKSNKGTADIQSAVTSTATAPQAYFAGEYNIDWNCTAIGQSEYIGAVYAAVYMLQSLNGCPLPFWAAIHDAFSDGTCGIITDPNMTLVPVSVFFAQAVRNVFGPRYAVTVNSAGLLTCACKPSAGHFGLMVVNYGQNAQNGQKVALSHWPVNTSGNGTANVWQLTSANGNGQLSTVAVTAGVTATMNFPDPSITILYI